ncbi:GxxExxY protein [Anabaena subtropica]|nr:GxxExxY protein [Anabaena subtropica]
MTKNEIAGAVVDVALADKRVGLLINFNVILIKDGISRVGNNL